MGEGERRVGMMQMTPELMRELIGLPEENTLLGVDFDFSTGFFNFYVTGPNLPVIPLGAPAMIMTPSMTYRNGRREWNWRT